MKSQQIDLNLNYLKEEINKIYSDQTSPSLDQVNEFFESNESVQWELQNCSEILSHPKYREQKDQTLNMLVMVIESQHQKNMQREKQNSGSSDASSGTNMFNSNLKGSVNVIALTIIFMITIIIDKMMCILKKLLAKNDFGDAQTNMANQIKNLIQKVAGK